LHTRLIEMPEFIYVNDQSTALIVDRMFGIGINSEDRCEAMLHALAGAPPPATFWSVFHTIWPECDAAWHWRSWLLRYLRDNHKVLSGSGELRGEDRAFFERLPDPVQVYRGCSWARVRGVSWTTHRTVAERFAHGHRGIHVPWPVLASATIPKSAVFGAYDERNESEVVLDPRRLRRVEVVKWQS
jgi:hypothetical protein